MESKSKFNTDNHLTLMEQVKQVHYGYWTEQAYCDWIVRSLGFREKTAL